MTFKIGDVAWLPRTAPTQVRTECPVCFGKSVVTVVLGNGEHVETACDYCGKGFEGPKGWTMEYDQAPATERVVITGVVEKATASGRTVIYQRGDEWEIRPEDLFADEASAFAEAARRVESWLDEEERRMHAKKKSAVAHATWTVGYHRREAKRAREEMERHEARIRVIRASSTPPPEAAP